MPTDVKVEISQELADTDWDRLTGWREHVFPEEGIGTEWIGSQQHVVGGVDGSIVAHLGFGVYPLILDSRQSSCIGVGGVVVLPEFQGQHLPNRLFAELRAWREREFAELPLTLFCPARLVNYYNRHGFREVTLPVSYDQSGRSVPSALPFMSDRPLGAVARIELPTCPW